MNSPLTTSQWGQVSTEMLEQRNLSTHLKMYVCAMIAYYFSSVSDTYAPIVDDNAEHIFSTVVTHLASCDETTQKHRETMRFMPLPRTFLFHYDDCSTSKSTPYSSLPTITVDNIAHEMSFFFPVPMMDYVFAHADGDVDTVLSCLTTIMDCRAFTYKEFPIVDYIVRNINDLNEIPLSWILDMARSTMLA